MKEPKEKASVRWWKKQANTTYHGSNLRTFLYQEAKETYDKLVSYEAKIEHSESIDPTDESGWAKYYKAELSELTKELGLSQ